MAYCENGQFFIDGKPQLVLSGEVHYFRLKRSEWEDRVRKTKEAGCNAIASYIPWLFHEEKSGEIDVVGQTRPERDIAAFVDLCKRYDLWFIPRPGPYIMAEVKNEGLPHWVFTECESAKTVIWNGEPAKSKVVRYNDPSFLERVEQWYAAVIPPLATRQDTKGGNVIALQLDNEIGMLQCWSEDPDLSDDTLCAFAEYVQRNGLTRRYSVDMGDPAARNRELRNPNSPSALAFRTDYSHFIRGEFARYVKSLRRFSEKYGLADVPFIVNIHGSGGGRATTFPIGIAQTFQSYTQDAGYWGSSDHYLGDLTRDNAGDLYMLNAFMAAVNRPEQPLSSVEFEAGSGDYGEIGGHQYPWTATDFKARVSVLQKNRLLNHYLMAGGRNPMLDTPLPDGNGRLGTTGERHGFAAPIDPEGFPRLSYHSVQQVNHVLSAVGSLLATGQEELDDIALGFIPDYYTTDIKPAGPMRDLASKLEFPRAWQERLVRAMLQRGLSFSGQHLSPDIPIRNRTLALATSACMDPKVASHLLRFANNGGNLLLFGAIPTLDMDGEPMTVMTKGLGVTPQEPLRASHDSFPSIVGAGIARLQPETRIWEGTPFTVVGGEPIFRIAQRTDHLGGALIPYGSGKIILMTVMPPQHERLWRTLFDFMGVKPAVEHNDFDGGLLLQRFTAPEGQLLSVINLDHVTKLMKVQGVKADGFDGVLYLPARTAKLLPINAKVQGFDIVFSTTEIKEVKDGALVFHQSMAKERARFRHPVRVEGRAAVKQVGDVYEVEIAEGQGLVTVSRVS